MKRFGLVASAVCVLALAAGGTASANGYTSDRDWVLGAIKRTSLDGTVDQTHLFGAWETRTAADGLYSAAYRTIATGAKASYAGRVTCINVVGNNAYIGIRVTQSSNRPDAVVGSGEIIRVTKWGSSSTGQKDAVSPGVFSATPPTVCPAPYADTSPTYWGGVLMHDGDL
jgi:hypothetical protein